MAVYRFRIIFEDQEDVLREIDIKGKQNYEELHRAIQEAISFDGLKDASFFISDDLWRKGEELALNPPVYDEDDETPKHKRKIVRKMSASRIADHVDDPHQRFVYVSDPEVKWTLLVELVKILPDDPKVNYPKTIKSTGAAPRQYKQVIVPPPLDEEDDEEDKKSKEKIFTDEMAYDEAEHGAGTAVEEDHSMGGEGEGESEGEGEGEGESEGEGEGEESGSDFDPGSFGSEEDY